MTILKDNGGSLPDPARVLPLEVQAVLTDYLRPLAHTTAERVRVRAKALGCCAWILAQVLDEAQQERAFQILLEFAQSDDKELHKWDAPGTVA